MLECNIWNKFRVKWRNGVTYQFNLTHNIIGIIKDGIDYEIYLL